MTELNHNGMGVKLMKIVLLDGYHLNRDLNWDAVRALGECTFYDRTQPDDNQQILARIGDAEIVITHKTPIQDSVISQVPNLKYIGVMGTGYDAVDIASAKQHQVTVTTVPNYSTDAVAQYAISLLLEVTGQVGLHNRVVHDGKWSTIADFTFWEKPLIELKGKTIGLIGYGRIAQQVAKIAHAFAMNVIFYNHRPKNVTDDWAHQVSFDELLQKADIISLHVPQTPETINLINQASIAKMKDGVIVINTARGTLIDESAMAAALNEDKVLALATDVVATEPIDPQNPLLTAKNCFITQHIAWAPLETRERLLDIITENIQAFIAGKPINQVN